MKIVESMEELARLRAEKREFQITSGNGIWNPLITFDGIYQMYEEWINRGKIRVKPKMVKKYGATLIGKTPDPFAIYNKLSKSSRNEWVKRHYPHHTIINKFSYEVTE